jgi:predicted RNase H-like HicB family nuclease
LHLPTKRKAAQYATIYKRKHISLAAKEAIMPAFVTLDAYQEAAMRQAEYETLPDGTCFGRIPGFQGVWASAPTLEACRDELRDVLEGWMRLRLAHDLDLPDIDGVTPIISTNLCPWHA